jgi:Meckel syndrome type 1 protein
VGTPVLAAACGTVTLAGIQSGYGKIVCIRHTRSFSTCYAHLSSFAVARGARVVVGQRIGRVGMTGRTSGPHLHFETRVDGRPRDPAPYLGGTRTIPGAAAKITTG